MILAVSRLCSQVFINVPVRSLFQRGFKRQSYKTKTLYLPISSSRAFLEFILGRQLCYKVKMLFHNFFSSLPEIVINSQTELGPWVIHISSNLEPVVSLFVILFKISTAKLVYICNAQAAETS